MVKVDAYNGINSYLAELRNANVKTIEDVVHYNVTNVGSEGGEKGVHPAFPSGQVIAIHSRRNDHSNDV